MRRRPEESRDDIVSLERILQETVGTVSQEVFNYFQQIISKQTGLNKMIEMEIF